MDKINQKQMFELYLGKHFNFLTRMGYAISNVEPINKGERIVLSNKRYNREIDFFWGVRNNNILV